LVDEAAGRNGDKPKGKRVCVIGAGLAGLACAYELRAAGYEVQVVEARNRIGGRVLTLTDFVKGRYVEAGGEWIGRNHPTWLAYAKRFDLKLVEAASDDDLWEPIILAGKALDKKEAALLYIQMKAIQTLMTADAAAVNTEEPWKTPFAAALDRFSVGDTAVVSCAGGKSFEADDVVLAVPPTMYGKIKVRPELPSGLAPQMGQAVKYLVGVRRRFWKDKKRSATSFSDGPMNATWEATDGQPGDQDAVLVAFLSGPAAQTFKAQKPADREAFYGAELEKIYPGSTAQIVRTLFMNWPGDPWVDGAYSSPAPGQVTTAGRLPARPHAERLHFAGEHTSMKFGG
jgi:monoamine oxidase